MKKLVLFIFIVTYFSPGCIQQPEADRHVTSISKEIPEISRGILQGYLTEKEMPNSLILVAPPPAEGTAAYALDMEMATMYVASTDEARREQAAKDAVLHFPEAMDAFNIILDIKISEEATPNLYMIMRRTLADAGLSTYAAKNYYKRERPFMVNNGPICTPEQEEGLRMDGSYPSGHTSIGWAWALILAEIFPDQADDILVRGKEFGISRNVCNVHWNSDVEAGRMMGSATVAKLHSNEDFMTDLAAAKEEISILMANK